MSPELFAFLLAAGAGLATVLGAGVAVIRKRQSPRVLGAALAFAAGAMLLVSMVEILPEARGSIGSWWPVLALAGVGALIVVAMQAGLARVVPRQRKGARTGMLVALAMALHNLPEGAAPFVSALASPEAGIVIALAIALHNIPEGIAIASPLLAGGASRGRAVAIATVAGLAEAAGAGIAWALAAWLSEALVGGLLAAVAGIMIWLSVAELLPAARRAVRGFAPVAGALGGMSVMAVSLMLL